MEESAKGENHIRQDSIFVIPRVIALLQNRIAKILGFLPHTYILKARNGTLRMRMTTVSLSFPSFLSDFTRSRNHVYRAATSANETNDAVKRPAWPVTRLPDKITKIFVIYRTYVQFMFIYTIFPLSINIVFFFLIRCSHDYHYLTH